jgi:hypothetical protein
MWEGNQSPNSRICLSFLNLINYMHVLTNILYFMEQKIIWYPNLNMSNTIFLYIHTKAFDILNSKH